MRPAPATPKRDPIIATPAVVLIAAALALPRMTPSPVPMKGAASPPVNPIKVPPAIVATPIEAYLLIFRILSLRLTSLCSTLFHKNSTLKNMIVVNRRLQGILKSKTIFSQITYSDKTPMSLLINSIKECSYSSTKSNGTCKSSAILLTSTLCLASYSP